MKNKKDSALESVDNTIGEEPRHRGKAPDSSEKLRAYSIFRSRPKKIILTFLLLMFLLPILFLVGTSVMFALMKGCGISL